MKTLHRNGNGRHNGETADSRAVLITGGAGFVGTNLADRLAGDGHRVIVLDNLSRAGVKRNAAYLRARHPDRIRIEVADVTDQAAVRRAVGQASHVFHFAGQVAVTTSLDDPTEDFEVNLRGTLNVLEAIRRLDPQKGRRPPLLFTSTNKVYGDLRGLALEEAEDRYRPTHAPIRENGFAEGWLDFHSPYGCSKGAADQYVLDYARSYGLESVVFRMSCIYGPHQCGNEDQGWVAHFLMAAMRGEPITLYGDGKQVRDVLFVQDLADAMTLAMDRIDQTAGEAFNMGGGPDNAVSLLQMLQMIGDAAGREADYSFSDWRRGDQKYYVSDTRKFRKLTGWQPKVVVREGVARLYQWLSRHNAPPAGRTLEAQRAEAAA